MSDDVSPDTAPATDAGDLIKKVTTWAAAYGFSAEDTNTAKQVCKRLAEAKPRPAAAPAPGGDDRSGIEALFPNWTTFGSLEECISTTLTELRRGARAAAAAPVGAPVTITPPVKPGGPDLITILYMQFLPRVVKAKRPMNMGLNGAPVSEKPTCDGYYRVLPDGTIERWERLKNKAQYQCMGSFKIEGFDDIDEDDNPNAPKFTPAAARRMAREANQE